MKYLVLLVVIFVVIWVMRSGRPAQPRAPGNARAAPPPPPQDMVECPVCHVHLPRNEALPGPGGELYCCAEHRQRASS